MCPVALFVITGSEAAQVPNTRKANRVQWGGPSASRQDQRQRQSYPPAINDNNKDTEQKTSTTIFRYWTLSRIFLLQLHEDR